MAKIEQRLEELGIILPQPAGALANYVSIRQVGDLLYVSGSGPLADGKPTYRGRVGAEVSVEEAYDAARLTAINIIASLKVFLGDLDKVEQFVKLLGFVASSDDFYQQPKVIDGASDLLIEVFGEAGKHARSAVGTSVLPFNIPLEIEAIVQIKE